MHGLLCALLLVLLTVVDGRPYSFNGNYGYVRYAVHNTRNKRGADAQAKSPKSNIDYPHDTNAQKRDGGCYGHDCGGLGGGGADFGGHAGFDAGHAAGGFAGAFTGHGDENCGFGHLDHCGHDEHTTYVPSHSPPVHVGPNAPPIHVGPHVPAVHVGPHVPSIHYGTHAPIYHVGPHVPFVHMPPPVTTVHAGPMGPPIHVSSPPTVYHQPPVVYHQPHIVGHADDHAFGAGGDAGYGGAHHETTYVGGDHGGDYGGGYGGPHHDTGVTYHDAGGQGGDYGGYAAGH